MKAQIYRRFYKSILLVLRLAFIIVLGATTQVWAAQTVVKGKSGRESATTTSNSVSGRVGSIRGGYISVIYNTETREDGSIREWEMLLPVDKNLTLTNRQSLGQIEEGDEITVGYDESNWIENDVRRTERKTKTLRFISPAVKGLRSGNN